MTHGKILIIEDDPAVGSSLKFALEVEGFLARAYQTGAELLNDTDIPEDGCLVVDYKLPDMNGLDLDRGPSPTALTQVNARESKQKGRGRTGKAGIEAGHAASRRHRQIIGWIGPTT